MLRFIGMARSVPSSAKKNVHAPRTCHGRCVPPGRSGEMLSIRSAGMAETIVPPVAYPAADAVDCMQLFSRIVIRMLTIETRMKNPQIENDRMHAVMATPRCHPVFRPT